MSSQSHNPAPPFEAPTEDAKTYTGVCHCQATKFTISLPKLTSVNYCNCSYCVSKDILWLESDSENLKFKRKGDITAYEFSKKKITFYFCSQCGNFIHDVRKDTGKILINARLLELVDTWTLKRDLVHDFSGDAPPRAPPFTGPPFEDEASDENKKKDYFAHCHCGAVTASLRTKPWAEQKVVECNCSWCVRWGAVNAHLQDTNEIHFGGWQNLTAYTPRAANWSGYFCKTCGDHLVIATKSEKDSPKDASTGKPLENAEQKLGYPGKVFALHLRVLTDKDWEEVDRTKWPGRDHGTPYVVK